MARSRRHRRVGVGRVGRQGARNGPLRTQGFGGASPRDDAAAPGESRDQQMTQVHGNLRNIERRLESGRDWAAEASGDWRSEWIRRELRGNPRRGRQRQIRHVREHHRHRQGGNEARQRRGTAALMHEAVCAGRVLIPIPTLIGANVVQAMIVSMPMVGLAVIVPMRIGRGGDRMLDGMQVAELGQHRLDHQPEHQHGQEAGAQGSDQTGQMGMHLN